MQGEYKGKPIFRHRYVGMDEDAIREEIDRLQDELYSMQEALDFLYSNSNEARQEVANAQLQNERLLKAVDEKLDRLYRSLDYEAPIKTQLEVVKKDITENYLTVNNDRWKKIFRLTYLNTFLLIALVGVFLLIFIMI